MSDTELQNMSLQSLYEKIVDDVYKRVHEKLGMKDLMTEEAMQVVWNSMEVVDTYKELPGSQKKAVVMKVVRRVIDELPEGNTKKALLFIHENVLSPIIDGVVDFVKGKFDLNKDGKVTKDEVKQRFRRWFCCCRK